MAQPYMPFQDFIEQLGLGAHNLNTNTLKAYLSNATPSASGDAVKGDCAEISAASGYVTGGTDLQNTYTETGGTGTLVGVDPPIWQASASDWGPFQWVVVFNDDATSPADALVNWWEYGVAPLTLLVGETFALELGADLFTIGPAA